MGGEKGKRRKKSTGWLRPWSRGLSSRVQALWAFLSELDNRECLTLVTARVPEHISLSPSIYHGFKDTYILFNLL